MPMQTSLKFKNNSKIPIKSLVESITLKPCPGHLLAIAAHFHRSGLVDKEAANKLAAATLSASEDKNAAISKAIGLLATQEYSEALKKIQETRDWNALADVCEAIAQKYGRGWKYSKHMGPLAKKLREQPVGPTPLRALEGMTLSEQDHQFAREIADLEEAPQSLSNFPQLLWIFPLNERFSGYFSRSENKGDLLLKKVVDRGREAVPLLIAMLGDHTFLPYTLSETSNNTLDGIDFESLPIPATRASFASSLAVGLVPGFESYQVDPENLRGALIDWYKRAKDQSLTDIAREVLHSGTEQQSEQAMVYLYDHGNEKDFVVIERNLVDEAIDSPWSGFSAIADYVKKRGEAGKGFVKRLESDLEKHLAILKDDSEQEDSYKSTKQSFDENLKTLHSLLSSETAADILARVVTGEDKLEKVYGAVGEKLKEEHLPDRITTLITAAASPNASVEIRNSLLRFLSYVTDGEEAEKDAKLPPPSVNAELWKKLLKDKRKPEESGSEIRLTAAFAIEQLYSSDKSVGLGKFWSRSGVAGSQFLTERALARVEGKTEDQLPPFPRPEDVSEERRATLSKDLLALASQPDEFRKRLASLPLAELFFVVGERQHDLDDESPKQAPLTEAVSKLQNTFGEVTAPEGWAGFDTWSGDVFSLEKFDHLVTEASKHAKAGEAFEIEMKSEGPFGPVKVKVEATTLEKMTKSEGDKKEKKAEIEEDEAEQIQTPIGRSISQLQHMVEKEKLPVVGASMGGAYYNIYWFPGEKEADEENSNPNDQLTRMRERMEETQKQFRNNLRYYSQPAVSLPNPIHLKFFGTTVEPQKEEEEEK